MSYTQDAFSGGLLYENRLQAQTGADGTTTVDQLPDWNTVKNVQVVSDGAQKLFLTGSSMSMRSWGCTTRPERNWCWNGTKLANVITGSGDDLIDIRMVFDQNSVWVDSFRIATGAGKGTVLLSGFDIDGERAAGDMTFIEAENKPGLALVNTGEGRATYAATGANDDRIVGYISKDHLVAGTDDGSVTTVTTAVDAGFGYAVNGST